MLKVGDCIYCMKSPEGAPKKLTIGSGYRIMSARDMTDDKVIEICADDGGSWSFGQEGYQEPWTNWFISETQWKRQQILDQLV